MKKKKKKRKIFLVLLWIVIDRLEGFFGSFSFGPFFWLVLATRVGGFSVYRKIVLLVCFCMLQISVFLPLDQFSSWLPISLVTLVYPLLVLFILFVVPVGWILVVLGAGWFSRIASDLLLITLDTSCNRTTFMVLSNNLSSFRAPKPWRTIITLFGTFFAAKQNTVLRSSCYYPCFHLQTLKADPGSVRAFLFLMMKGVVLKVRTVVYYVLGTLGFRFRGVSFFPESDRVSEGIVGCSFLNQELFESSRPGRKSLSLSNSCSQIWGLSVDLGLFRAAWQIWCRSDFAESGPSRWERRCSGLSVRVDSVDSIVYSFVSVIWHVNNPGGSHGFLKFKVRTGGTFKMYGGGGVACLDTGIIQLLTREKVLVLIVVWPTHGYMVLNGKSFFSLFCLSRSGPRWSGIFRTGGWTVCKYLFGTVAGSFPLHVLFGLRNSILNKLVMKLNGLRLATLVLGKGSDSFGKVQIFWDLIDTFTSAQIKGLVGCSLISVYYVNYVGFLFFCFSLGGDSSLVLHQRNFVCAVHHHHQFHPSPATSCQLDLNGIHLRRVLCSPTRDISILGSGFCSLRRVLRLPTRGNDLCEGIALSRFGLFLWIVREILNDGVWLCPSDFNHSFRRMDYISSIKQRMFVPIRTDLVLTVFWSFQFLFSASLHGFSKHHPNHTTPASCVPEGILHQHDCGGLNWENRYFSLAEKFRDYEQVLLFVDGNRLVLGWSGHGGDRTESFRL